MHLRKAEKRTSLVQTFIRRTRLLAPCHGRTAVASGAVPFAYGTGAEPLTAADVAIHGGETLGEAASLEIPKVVGTRARTAKVSSCPSAVGLSKLQIAASEAERAAFSGPFAAAV